MMVVLTLSFGMLYVGIQQVLRQSANDPQVEIARDAAPLLVDHAPTDLIPVSSPTIDIGKSLSPFLIIVDPSGKSVASTGRLDASIPTIPSGALDYAKTHGENRLTWQPRSGVRIASVIVSVPGDAKGFVVAGRSLEESEARTAMIGKLIALGWLGCFVLIGVVCVLLTLMQARKNRVSNNNL